MTRRDLCLCVYFCVMCVYFCTIADAEDRQLSNRFRGQQRRFIRVHVISQAAIRVSGELHRHTPVNPGDRRIRLNRVLPPQAIVAHEFG